MSKIHEENERFAAEFRRRAARGEQIRSEISGYAVDEIRNRINEVEGQLTRLQNHDRLTRAQEDALEGLNIEYDELRSTLRTAEDRAALVDAVKRGIPNTENGTPHSTYEKADNGRATNAGTLHTNRSGNGRGEAFRAIERANAKDRAKQAATVILENASAIEESRMAAYFRVQASPEYKSAFCKLLRDPIAGFQEMTAEEHRAFVESKTLARAMSLTDSAGGYLIPFDLDPSIVLTNTGNLGAMRRVARTVTTTSDTWNGITSAGVTASWDAEAAEVSDDSPTLSQPSIPVYKGAAFIAASIEAAEDENVSQIVAGLCADAKTRLEEVAFVTGSGSGQPTGLVTAVSATAGSVVKVATDGVFALADVYSVQDDLPDRYQDRAQWMMSKTIANKARQFDNSASRQFALVDSLAGPVSRTLLGDPLNLNNNFDSTIDGAADHYILAYGDFSNYVIVDRIGMSVEFIPHLFATGNNRPSGQRGWYAHWRTGADSINDDAFRVLTTDTA